MSNVRQSIIKYCMDNPIQRESTKKSLNSHLNYLYLVPNGTLEEFQTLVQTLMYRNLSRNYIRNVLVSLRAYHLQNTKGWTNPLTPPHDKILSNTFNRMICLKSNLVARLNSEKNPLTLEEQKELIELNKMSNLEKKVLAMSVDEMNEFATFVIWDFCQQIGLLIFFETTWIGVEMAPNIPLELETSLASVSDVYRKKILLSHTIGEVFNKIWSNLEFDFYKNELWFEYEFSILFMILFFEGKRIDEWKKITVGMTERVIEISQQGFSVSIEGKRNETELFLSRLLINPVRRFIELKRQKNNIFDNGNPLISKDEKLFTMSHNRPYTMFKKKYETCLGKEKTKNLAFHCERKNLGFIANKMGKDSSSLLDHSKSGVTEKYYINPVEKRERETRQRELVWG